MKKSEMLKAIRNYVESKPNRDISVCLCVSKIGRLYIHILDLSNSKIEKIEIADFYKEYVK